MMCRHHGNNANGKWIRIICRGGHTNSQVQQKYVLIKGGQVVRVDWWIVQTRDFHPGHWCSCPLWKQKSTLTFYHYIGYVSNLKPSHNVFVPKPNQVVLLLRGRGHFPSFCQITLILRLNDILCSAAFKTHHWNIFSLKFSVTPDECPGDKRNTIWLAGWWQEEKKVTQQNEKKNKTEIRIYVLRQTFEATLKQNQSQNGSSL